MFKALALCTSFMLLSHTGCMETRPKPDTPEVANKHFTDQLANKCPGKQLNPEKFNDFAKEYRNDADVQSQQLIDLDTTKACAANGSQPECYNTGFIQAEIEMGGIDEIVKHACHL
jgi:hypothetical protein